MRDKQVNGQVRKPTIEGGIERREVRSSEHRGRRGERTTFLRNQEASSESVWRNQEDGKCEDSNCQCVICMNASHRKTADSIEKTNYHNKNGRHINLPGGVGR